MRWQRRGFILTSVAGITGVPDASREASGSDAARVSLAAFQQSGNGAREAFVTAFSKRTNRAIVARFTDGTLFPGETWKTG